MTTKKVNAQFTYYRDVFYMYPFLCIHFFVVCLRVSLIIVATFMGIYRFSAKQKGQPKSCAIASVGYLLLISSVNGSKTHFVTLIFYCVPPPTLKWMCSGQFVCIRWRNTRLANLWPGLSAAKPRPKWFIWFGLVFNSIRWLSGCCPFVAYAMETLPIFDFLWLGHFSLFGFDFCLNLFFALYFHSDSLSLKITISNGFYCLGARFVPLYMSPAWLDFYRFA